MPSLFLHRISVVRVSLSIAATTQDPADQDPRQTTDHVITDSENRRDRNKILKIILVNAGNIRSRYDINT